MRPTDCCLKCYLKKMSYQHLGAVNFWKLLADLFVQQRGICAYTGRRLRLGVNASIDHFHPRSRFPHLSNDINNLRWVHIHANQAKAALDLREFILLCQDVVRYMHGK